MIGTKQHRFIPCEMKQDPCENVADTLYFAGYRCILKHFILPVSPRESLVNRNGLGKIHLMLLLAFQALGKQ